ncbi:MAG: hypothetical protein COC19_03305 [SAR86 cluster bacterium]|uniref:LPS-assembly protein LptD n=1 Tax=SAR86 cluster bacterium TaxID=2030880 RepID=A0A2A4MQF8_9GAMM|nr:MAG: hypothetical protein COC19_03305 [SAR86 cluster bacterium]
MPFKRQVLHANISLIIASGFLLSLCASESVAQSPQVACRANDAGDGWVCSTIDSDGTTVAISRSNRPRSNSNTISTASATISSTRSSQSLDWLSKSQMSDQQLQALDNNCCGAFIEPLRENIDINADPSEAETRFDAIQGFSQQQTGQYQIDGDILVQQGNRTIENDNTTLINTNNGDNSVSMQGNVVFREPNVLLLGDGAFIDNSRGINRIDAAQYVLHDLGVHGSAEQLVYDSNSGLLTLINGEFSRCEPQQPLWRLRADTITIDQEQGRGYAKNVSLLIGNIPVFYYPFTLPFPLGEERISGLLAPSTGSTSSGGFDFSLPYYFNLAPNYDATVTPRLISDRGVMLSTELRYLSKRSMNTLNLSHLAKDKLFDATTADIAGSDSPPVENRWFIGYEQMAQLNQSWSTLIDYSAVSDVDYFRDLGSTGLNVVSRTHLNREARLNYNQGSTRAGIKLQSIQIIDPFVSEADINRPYDKLPQLFFNTQWRLPAGFKLGLSSQLTAFDRSLDQALLAAVTSITAHWSMAVVSI